MAKIYYKSEEEILKIKESSLLVGKAHAVVAEYIEPGVQTSKLDKLAEEFILDSRWDISKGSGRYPEVIRFQDEKIEFNTITVLMLPDNDYDKQAFKLLEIRRV